MQLSLVLVGLGLLYGEPPASGRMLLIPMTPHARTELVPAAVAHGARLVASGRIAGSLVVEGRRDQLAVPLLRRGILPVRAFAGACGETVEGVV
ncbi:hypothetical protein PMI04_005305 [Sphingobium sp. AP49]|uniref:hypothetical protein n=1 Tax=Sphingobium sp. AP49 TaxID=1144307 RepID=UPI000309C38B|nr:hypothetical protein [Sphingobium sp. AP49]WHO40010.1 hypothetical protein PMI04_005305 [Sphingobium sp. AP49]